MTAVLNFLCSKNQSSAIPDPANCAKFYDCSKLLSSTTLQDMTTECKYPDLFSVKDGKCQDFKSVNCTTRKEPMAPCMLFFSTLSFKKKPAKQINCCSLSFVMNLYGIFSN